MSIEKESYDPEEEKRQREARRADADGTGKKETFKATVSEIVDGSCFYLQNMVGVHCKVWTFRTA